MKNILLIFLSLISIRLLAQNYTVSEFKLKNGYSVKGIIIDSIPNVSYKLKTLTGVEQTYSIEEIELNTTTSIDGTSKLILEPIIGRLNCNNIINNGKLFKDVPASLVSSNLSYTNANGGFIFNEFKINSEGVLGLTASLVTNFLENGDGNLNFIITGTPKDTGIAIFNINLFGSTCSITRTVSSLIGTWHQGGVISYIYKKNNKGFLNNEIHGIIISPNDQDSSIWGCLDIRIGSTANEIGFGLSNTNLIIESCPENLTAAKQSKNLDLNGYKDWYIPSIDELNEIYLNLTEINKGLILNGGNSIKKTNYWSSTEFGGNYANCFEFDTGNVKISRKSNLFNVRAIRTF